MTLTKLISLLLFWISNNTSYDTSKFDYKVNIVDKKVIQEIVCNGKCPIVAYFGPEQGVLLSKGDYDDACFQSILLHEIIHVFQHQNYNEMQNVFKEKEAYEIQNKFLVDESLKSENFQQLNIKKCRSIQANDLN